MLKVTQNKLVPEGFDQALILKFFCTFVDAGIDEVTQKKKPTVNWICNICKSGQHLDCKSGFSNIFKHVIDTAKHSEWRTEYNRLKDLDSMNELNGPMDLFIKSTVSERAKQINSWIRLVVFKNCPFDIVEDSEYRRFSKFGGISTRFLKKVKWYLHLVYSHGC